jgi:hypothetical protein
LSEIQQHEILGWGEPMLFRLISLLRLIFLHFWVLSFILFCFTSIYGSQKDASNKENINLAKEKKLDEQISTGIEAFFATDLGDTDVKIAENRKKAFEKLTDLINDQKIKLIFPIENISEENGIYNITIGNPSFPKVKISKVQRWGGGSLNHFEIKLKKEQALKISSICLLEISGIPKLRLSDFSDSSPRSTLGYSFPGIQSEITAIEWIGGQSLVKIPNKPGEFFGDQGWKSLVSLVIEKPIIKIIIKDKQGGKKEIIEVHNDKNEIQNSNPRDNIINILSQKIESFFNYDYGDTEFKNNVERNKKLDKIANIFNGRHITVDFPINNITFYNGYYYIKMDDPKFPGSHRYEHAKYILLKLSKDEAIKVNKTSVLEVSGSIKLQGGMQFFDERSFTTGANSRFKIINWIDVMLIIEKPTIKIIINNELGKKKGVIIARPLPARLNI